MRKHAQHISYIMYLLSLVSVLLFLKSAFAAKDFLNPYINLQAFWVYTLCSSLSFFFILLLYRKNTEPSKIVARKHRARERASLKYLVIAFTLSILPSAALIYIALIPPIGLYIIFGLQENNHMAIFALWYWGAITVVSLICRMLLKASLK